MQAQTTCKSSTVPDNKLCTRRFTVPSQHLLQHGTSRSNSNLGAKAEPGPFDELEGCPCYMLGWIKVEAELGCNRSHPAAS